METSYPDFPIDALGTDSLLDLIRELIASRKLARLSEASARADLDEFREQNEKLHEEVARLTIENRKISTEAQRAQGINRPISASWAVESTPGVPSASDEALQVLKREWWPAFDESDDQPDALDSSWVEGLDEEGRRIYDELVDSRAERFDDDHPLRNALPTPAEVRARRSELRRLEESEEDDPEEEGNDPDEVAKLEELRQAFLDRPQPQQDYSGPDDDAAPKKLEQ